MQCRYLLHKHILVYNSMERVRSIDNHRIKGLYDSVKKWYCFVFVSIVYPSDDFRVSTSVKVIIECYYNAIYYNAISVFKNKSKELIFCCFVHFQYTKDITRNTVQSQTMQENTTQHIHCQINWKSDGLIQLLRKVLLNSLLLFLNTDIAL
jgi:hypothetical protein